MSRFLLTLGNLTLGGSAAILVLALAGRSTRARYGARWRCWVWLILCLRLAVPLPLLPSFSDRAPIQVPVPPATVQTPDPGPVTPPPDASASGGAELPRPGRPGDGSAPTIRQEPSDGPSIDPAAVLLGLWLTGAAAVLIQAAVAHGRFLAYLRRWSAPVADSAVIALYNSLGDRLELDRRPRLLTCRGLKVPMLAGLLRPALLLPPDGPMGEQLRHSLLHELTHFRRRDIWLKTLALWVKALFWFNPLCWLMCRLIERDTELACDEAALKLLPREEHGAYGQTILTAVEKLKAPSSL